MKHIILTICIWLQFSGASATIVFFDNDFDGFEVASTTNLTDFDTFLGSALVSANVFTLEIDGNEYSNSGNNSGVQICSTYVCQGNPFDSALIYAAGGNGTLRIDLVAGVSAVGGIFGDLNGPAGQGTLSLYGSNGGLLETRTVQHGDMGAGLNKTFYGWTSEDMTFSALEFTILGVGDVPSTMWAALDDLRFGSVASLDKTAAAANGVSAVPLPATFWLFLTAVSGLFGFNRWRGA